MVHSIPPGFWKMIADDPRSKKPQWSGQSLDKPAAQKKNGAMANKGSVNSTIYSTRTRWNMLKSKDTKKSYKNLTKAVDIKILKIFQDTYCKDIKDVPNDFGNLEYQSEALKPSNTDRRLQFFQCFFYLRVGHSKSKPCRPFDFKLRNLEFKIYIVCIYNNDT